MFVVGLRKCSREVESVLHLLHIVLAPVYATFMYQYLGVTKLVDTCIVVVANQPKKPIKQGACRDAGVG